MEFPGQMRPVSAMLTGWTKFLRIAPLLFLTTLVSCSAPQRWSQFHGDSTNTGFLGTHSSRAARSKWFADVGPGYSSPAISLDGTIYVANFDGELVAVTPDGSIQWRYQTPYSDQPYIRSSPAVSNAGLIYFIVNHGVSGGTPGESVLYSLDRIKNVRCRFPFPPGFVTESSPNVWTSGNNTNVFVADIDATYFNGWLRVFDQECHQVAMQTWFCPKNLQGNPGCCSFQVPGIPISYPTPATIDSTLEKGKAIVVAGANTCGLRAFTWDPSALTLTPLWSAPDPAGNPITSPAISQSRQVVFGRADGHVKSFDLLTGTALWDYDAGEFIDPSATPAFFLGKTWVYLPSLAHLHKIDTDGSLLQKIDLASGNTGGTSAALTWDRVYIGSDAGLQTFRFDLSPDAIDRGAVYSGLPAIGSDGTVYIVATDHLLRAYPR
jgi:outer membrane protein assembly factor BamB